MKKEQSRHETLETIAILAAAALCLGVLFRTQILIYLALALLIIGIFVKRVAAAISHGWLAFGRILGRINATVILSLIFFLFLTPLAFFYRIFHGDFMEIRSDPERKSYFKSRDHVYSAADLKNPW